MSFSTPKLKVEEGDTVILYVSVISMYAIRVTPTIKSRKGQDVEHIFQTVYGALKVMDLVGKPYGSKVHLSKGWAHILHPTPELWTLTLPHRTQILYTPDISLIILQLDLQPGKVVVESGTGSGSLTHALARTVAPEGHVHTFDFHEQRVSLAQEEFLYHGLSSVVTARHRDVCKEGFGMPTPVADAVFLDLPSPWLAIPWVLQVLKPEGGRLCSFSPCLEQVQRTASALQQAGFVHLTTMECLQRELQVKTTTIPASELLSFSLASDNPSAQPTSFRTALAPLKMAGHTGYLTFATWPRQATAAPTTLV